MRRNTSQNTHWNQQILSYIKGGVFFTFKKKQNLLINDSLLDYRKVTKIHRNGDAMQKGGG